MDLREYGRVTRRYWWLLLLGPTVAALAALFVSNSITPVYRASATLLVNQTQSPGSVQYNDILTSERLTNTYAQLIVARSTIEATVAKLGAGWSADSLLGAVRAESVTNTQLLHVSVDNTDPVRAALAANTLADVFIAQNQGNLSSRPGTVSVVEPATTPAQPASPRVLLNTIIAVLLGVTVSTGLVAVREYLDDTVKDAAAIQESLGIATLGVVTRFGRSRKLKRNPSEGLAIGSRVASRNADAYRLLRTNIHFAAVDSAPRSIVVTSATPGEGKTTTAANLAVVFSQAGQRVLLVDADLRRPSLHLPFERSNKRGITTALLSEELDPRDVIQTTGIPNLSLVASGVRPPNPSELLGSQRMREFLKKCSEIFDLVVVDSPPALAFADTSVLAGITDASLLVVEVGGTRNQHFRQAAEMLSRASPRLLGVVLNKVSSRVGDYYYYYYSPKDEKDEKRRGLSGEFEAAGPELAALTLPSSLAGEPAAMATVTEGGTDEAITSPAKSPSANGSSLAHSRRRAFDEMVEVLQAAHTKLVRVVGDSELPALGEDYEKTAERLREVVSENED